MRWRASPLVSLSDPLEDEESSEYQYKGLTRAQTAPPKTMTSNLDFKRIELLKLIENALGFLSGFSHPYENQFDIDSEHGQQACKGFLKAIERLHLLMNLKAADRTYRKSFSKAYRILYKDKQLCYLTEILDSAQECKLNSCALSLC